MTRPFNQHARRFIPAAPYHAGVAAVSAILAHQGGWDEILLVLGPIVLIIGILAVVKRRVDRMGPPPPPA
jgi:hypothetical protein